MKFNNILKFAMAFAMLIPVFNANAQDIVSGEVWLDTSGNPINAHGGGILYHNGKYYWYGEYKKGKTVLPIVLMSRVWDVIRRLIWSTGLSRGLHFQQ